MICLLPFSIQRPSFLRSPLFWIHSYNTTITEERESEDDIWSHGTKAAIIHDERLGRAFQKACLKKEVLATKRFYFRFEIWPESGSPRGSRGFKSLSYQAKDPEERAGLKNEISVTFGVQETGGNVPLDRRTPFSYCQTISGKSDGSKLVLVDSPLWAPEVWICSMARGARGERWGKGGMPAPRMARRSGLPVLRPVLPRRELVLSGPGLGYPG
jgi:hypothetical protein